MKKVMNAALILVSAIFIVLVYSGLFSTIVISEEDVGPLTLVYRDHVGDYSETGKIQNEIYHALKKGYGIEATKGFGLYLDNPDSVDVSRLRSQAGCVLDGNDPAVAERIGQAFQVRVYPKVPSVVSRFPYRNQLSVFLGVVRVYPRLDEYMKKHRYKTAPALEVYDLGARVISYSYPRETDGRTQASSESSKQ